MICPFLFCCVGFSSPDKPKPIYWKVTAVLSMHMHDADSISRLCIHTPCHVWSNCLHAPDLPDLSDCHDPQWSDHWSPLIFHDLTSFDIARIEKQPPKFDAWQTKKNIHDSLIVCFVLFVRSLKNRLYIDSHFSPFVFSSLSVYMWQLDCPSKRIKTVRKLHFRTYR